MAYVDHFLTLFGQVLLRRCFGPSKPRLNCRTHHPLSMWIPTRTPQVTIGSLQESGSRSPGPVHPSYHYIRNQGFVRSVVLVFGTTGYQRHRGLPGCLSGRLICRPPEARAPFSGTFRSGGRSRCHSLAQEVETSRQEVLRALPLDRHASRG